MAAAAQTGWLKHGKKGGVETEGASESSILDNLLWSAENEVMEIWQTLRIAALGSMDDPEKPGANSPSQSGWFSRGRIGLICYFSISYHHSLRRTSLAKSFIFFLIWKRRTTQGEECSRLQGATWGWRECQWTAVIDTFLLHFACWSSISMTLRNHLSPKKGKLVRRNLIRVKQQTAGNYCLPNGWARSL